MALAQIGGCSSGTSLTITQQVTCLRHCIRVAVMTSAITLRIPLRGDRHRHRDQFSRDALVTSPAMVGNGLVTATSIRSARAHDSNGFKSVVLGKTRSVRR